MSTQAFASDLSALEETIRHACAERDRTVVERTRLMGEAGALADEIARIKSRSQAAARADRDLEDAMKRFDRITVQLDDVDARTATIGRGIAAARRRFDEAATAETARLTATAGSGPIAEITQGLRSIEEMRRRVSLLVAPRPAFRPVLDVTLSPEDGSADVERKLQLVEAERERVVRRVKEVDDEDAVFGTRAALKRQLLTELQNAARTAGPDLALLRRETDDSTEALGALAARRDALAQEKVDLNRALRELDKRSADFRTRLKSLESKGDPR
jgi:chromosome segregation ATPase